MSLVVRVDGRRLRPSEYSIDRERGTVSFKRPPRRRWFRRLSYWLRGKKCPPPAISVSFVYRD